jgi:hypothetical protein
MSPATHAQTVEFDHLPESWEPEAFVPRRPAGVAFVSILIAMGATVLIVASVFYLIGTYASGWLPAGVLPASWTVLTSLTPLSAGVLLVLGGALIGVSTALWRQESWALYILYVFTIGGVVYLLATGAFTVMLLLLVLLFLYLVAVRHYFY